MDIWICGQMRSYPNWEFQGAFSTRELAVAACKNDQYFIAPAVMDQEIIQDTFEWLGCEYPLAGK